MTRIPRKNALKQQLQRKEDTINDSGTYNLPADQSALSPSTPFRLVTHNIRYATNAPFKGEEPWSVRCPHLCSELVFNSQEPSTMICLQEVLHSQLLDIKEGLNASAHLDGEWSYVGVGRDDGKEAGEYSPIFYRPSVWSLESWKIVWLSETPNVPSKGWDASSTRIATFGFFMHLSGTKVLVVSTHLDDQGVKSRKESAKLILSILQKERGNLEYDVVLLGGDFNSTPEGEAYQLLTAPESPMVDVYHTIPREKCYGNEITFTGFSEESKPDRIDFVFAWKSDMGKRISVKTYAVLPNRFDDGVYLSDHRACVADFLLWA